MGCFFENKFQKACESKILIVHLQSTTSQSGAAVARRAHNPKVVGSSPASATTFKPQFFEAFLFGTILEVLQILATKKIIL